MPYSLLWIRLSEKVPLANHGYMAKAKESLLWCLSYCLSPKTKGEETNSAEKLRNAQQLQQFDNLPPIKSWLEKLKTEYTQKVK